MLIENLGMERITAQFVPHLLSVEQKINRVLMCQGVFESAQSDHHFISRIMASGDLSP